MRPLIVGFVVVLGMIRAGRGRDRRSADVEIEQLRYRVPLGQDAAAALAAVLNADFSARVEVVGGDEDIVVASHSVRDKERLRGVLADAPIDMTGHDFDTPPVTFGGE